MKIACISTSRVPSRTANSIQVMKTCQALAQTGAEVNLWVPGKIHYPWKELSGTYGLSAPMFEVHWLPSTPVFKRYDFALSSVARAISWKANIIYSWLPQATLVGLMRSKPAILEVHDRPTGRLGLWLLRRILASRGQKRLAIITQALADVLQSEFHLGVNPDNCVIAPNGADLERFENLPTPSEARLRLGFPDRISAIYTGHFYAGRGMELMEGLARACPQIQFVWVGGNPESVTYWRDRIAKQNLDNIILTGFIENQSLPLYQAAGEMLLMPYGQNIAGSSGGNSADICSPMKMFEYLATGRAIVTSDLPVLHEILNQQNAVFCPPDNIEAWSAALQSLAADPVQLAQLAGQAKIDAAGYTWRGRAEKILAGFN